ncbi:hypothetical protein TWF225_011192 [Orbilia oligospora]|nr:hypothetical protein TWF225_011192 [Orbilia oligospora]KAF3248194.1 hypothetical protein TWF217_009168 [Orbilia oligospora]KAF3250427.1 hypothetical protein TWF128_007570 [Orbilia oligospora]KAF3250428.1 hypothetical protein TWF128_007570 [Orbilia oligospora]
MQHSASNRFEPTTFSATVMSDTETGTHEPISGGCLCKAVKYSIAFPQGCWPPKKNNICHCTQCRKATGALMSHIITVTPSQITWTCEDRSFREYSSSNGVFRGFCQTCGSTLSWRNTKTPAEIDIFSGTLDEDVLIGGDGETGRKILMTDRQFWCDNLVPGVTDGAKSRFMYKTNQEGGVLGEVA